MKPSKLCALALCFFTAHTLLQAEFLPLSLHSDSQPKNIAVLGTGYVGLVLGAALAELGNNVVCLDIIEHKITMLQNGKIPIYEPGLAELVHKNSTVGRLRFSTDIPQAIKNNDVIFIAVGTPFGKDGKANLKAVEAVAHSIGKNINGYKLICTKSTVPIGTGKNTIRRIIEYYNHNQDFDVASNPEFLREGSAVEDFFKADRIIVGVDSPRAQKVLEEIYRPLINEGRPFLVTTLATAETIKYAANSFLATKISFINEMAELCDKVGADIKYVAEGMGLDKRIGQAFLNPGPGYGGSCFPKDTQALLYTARLHEVKLKVVHAAVEANEDQKYRILSKLYHLVHNDIAGKTVAILGLAFKANTDDVRYSPAIDIIHDLLQKKAHVKAYDPQAMANMKEVFPEITYCNSVDETVDGADVILILTEWPEIVALDLAAIKDRGCKAVILDARNVLDPALLRNLGFTFDNIGRSTVDR